MSEITGTPVATVEPDTAPPTGPDWLAPGDAQLPPDPPSPTTTAGSPRQRAGAVLLAIAMIAGAPAPSDDVAVIQLQGLSGAKTVTTADSSAVSVGDPVVAMGNAGGTGGAPEVVSGTVEAVNQTITASDPGGTNAETLTSLIQ